MAKSESPSPRRAPAYRQPALRSDLKIVYDNTGSEDAKVRIVDPKNGRQYSFDAGEQFLCSLLTNTLLIDA